MARQSSSDRQGGARNSALSAEERQLVTLTVSGFTNQEMASYLRLSESTIDRLMVRIRRKLGAANRFELLLAAVNELL